MCHIWIPPIPAGAACSYRANTLWRGSTAVCDVTRGRLPVHLLPLRRIPLTLVNSVALNLALYDTVKGRGNNYYFKKQVQGFHSHFSPHMSGVGAGWRSPGWQAGPGWGWAGRDICPPTALRRFHASGRPDDLGPGGTTCRGRLPAG